ncbi:protein-tyrosine phosphatase-like protein, partial [Trametes gibbosa]
LFLGPVSVASNAAFLTSKSISHVLPSPSSPARTVPLQYHRLRLVDSGASPSALSACTDAACTLLEAIRAEGGRALIHCSAGISRSPTVAVAYMVRHCGMTLRVALGTVVCARPAVCPNPDFVRWLKGEEV